jgi:hypothetical protein
VDPPPALDTADLAAAAAGLQRAGVSAEAPAASAKVQAKQQKRAVLQELLAADGNSFLLPPTTEAGTNPVPDDNARKKRKGGTLDKASSKVASSKAAKSASVRTPLPSLIIKVIINVII